jgi:hypothetical protein
MQPTEAIDGQLYASWAEAIGTFLAVVVALALALYQNWIRKRLFRPELDVAISMKPPDCLMVPTKPSQDSVIVANGYYLRMRVINEGKRRAQDVEVFASSLRKRQVDGTFKEVDSFSPMNLVWTHYGESVLPGISPKAYRHCGIGNILDPAARHQFEVQDLPDHPRDETLLRLNVAFASYTKFYLLEPGQYKLGIEITAANSEPVNRILEITLRGRWFDEADKMAEDGVGVRVLANRE